MSAIHEVATMWADDRERVVRKEIMAVLDECGAPTESGNIRLGVEGRIRAMRSELVTEANRLRSELQKTQDALDAAWSPLGALIVRDPITSYAPTSQKQEEK